MGGPEPERAVFLADVSVLRTGLTGTRVHSDGARPWGTKRSGDSEGTFALFPQNDFTGTRAHSP